MHTSYIYTYTRAYFSKSYIALAYITCIAPALYGGAASSSNYSSDDYHYPLTSLCIKALQKHPHYLLPRTYAKQWNPQQMNPADLENRLAMLHQLGLHWSVNKINTIYARLGEYSLLLDDPCAAFNHDSTIIALGREDETIELYNRTRPLKKIRRPKEYKNELKPNVIIKRHIDHTDNQSHDNSKRAISALAFNNKSTQLASGRRWDKKIYLFDLITNEWVHMFQMFEPYGYTHTLTFSPDDTLLLAGSRNGLIHIWNTLDGTHVQTVQASPHEVIISKIAFDRHGALFASSAYRTVALWNPSNWKEIGKLEHPFGVDAFTFTQNNTQLISTADRHVYLWDLLTQHCLRIIRTVSIREISFNHDGTGFITRQKSPSSLLWHVSDLSKPLVIGDRYLRSDDFITFNHDGTQFLAGYRLYNLIDISHLIALPPEQQIALINMLITKRYDARCSALENLSWFQVARSSICHLDEVQDDTLIVEYPSPGVIARGISYLRSFLCRSSHASLPLYERTT